MRAIIRLAALTVALFGAMYMLHDLYAGGAILCFGAIVDFVCWERE